MSRKQNMSFLIVITNVKEIRKTEEFGQLQINKASMWGCCGNRKGCEIKCSFAYKEHK